MRKFISWFFVIGCFTFLYFYLPEAMKDDMVTGNEIIMVSLNIFSFLINLRNILYSSFGLDENEKS